MGHGRRLFVIASEAKQSMERQSKSGLLRRGACYRARIRATRWLLAMTAGAQGVTNSTRRANHFWFSEIVSSPEIKNISLNNSGNQNHNSARLAPTRGAYHDRHDTWGAGCDGRFGVRRFLTPDENAKAYGEVVWSWRRDAGAKLVELSASDGDNKPAHRGEHEVSRK